ncbi:MAG: DUF6498-containing protein [archaeon]|nr:DUF6498-containing protein [archaeon]
MLSYEKVFNDKSLLSLILANFLTIILAAVFNWNPLVIVIGYWLQSIIIGFFNFIRILMLKNFSTEHFKINNKEVKPSSGIKIFIAFFFAFHYGFFHLVYGIFLSTFAGIYIVSQITSTQAVPIAQTLQDLVIAPLIMAVIFFINHLISFISNFKENTENQNIGKLMFKPYVRIIPIHLTILFGMLFLFSGGIVFTIFFMMLKTIADIILHQSEHGKWLKNGNLKFS